MLIERQVRGMAELAALDQRYQPTIHGIRNLVMDFVPHVVHAHVDDLNTHPYLGPGRIRVRLCLPRWSWLTMGLLRAVTRRRVRRVLEGRVPLGCTVTVA